MLDPAFIRENLDAVRANCANRTVKVDLDGFVRLDPASTNGIVRLDLDTVAHRFAPGHRIRLLIAGGSFPRWERNLGTDDDPAASLRGRHA